MNVKTQEPAVRFNGLKWLAVISLLISGLIANYYFTPQPLALRFSAWLILLVITGSLALQTEQGRRTKHFAREARMEMRKVVWPARKETLRTTLIVVIMVLIMALLLWGIDTGLIGIIGWLTGQRG